MRRRFLRALLLVAAGILSLAAGAQHLDIEQHHILILNSFHPYYPWTEEVVQGVTEVLRPQFPHSDFDIEYMDTKKYPTEELFPILETLYLAKYTPSKPDIIICTDTDALDFLLQKKSKLFPQVPVVFCGINNFDDSLITNRSKFTGVVEEISLLETVELALRLHPQTKTLAVISDTTSSGQLYRKHFWANAHFFQDRVAIRNLHDLTLPELEAELAGLPDNTVVLMLGFQRDRKGRFFSVGQSMAAITQNCDKPLYSVWKQFLDAGAVGGIISSGRQQGQQAGRLAAEILRGRPPSAVPIVREVQNHPIFHYGKLQEFGIPPEVLPDNAEIIQQPFSIYKEYRWYFWGVAVAFVVLLAFLLLLATNILSRKRAQKKLLASEERYRVLFEQSLNGVCIVDTQTNVCLQANPKFLEMVQASDKSISGWSMQNFFPADQSAFIDQSIQAILTGGETVALNIPLEKLNGERLYTDLRMSRTQVDGRDCDIMFWHDATIRRQEEQKRLELEGQVQQTQKLESLGVLAGGIAHDFNNILMGVLGNLDLALESTPPEATSRRHLDNIARAARRAADLCQQMLAYSGKGKFVVQQQSINALVLEMTKMIEVSISKKATLQCNLDENLPSFEGDGTQIRQVLLNLITNASESLGDASGTITITTGKMHCDKHYLFETYLDDNLLDGDYVFIEVSDTGCGMDTATRRKIFEPFFTTKFTGRGLGMAAVLGIVRGHKGAIKVYSEVDKGTTFKVFFPAFQEHINTRPPESEKQTPAPWAGDGKVLLIDDETEIQRVGAEMLQHLGFQVLVAPNGREGIALYAEQPDDIACVVLDLTMPEMDGEETFQELKKINPEAKVILSSGYNQQDVAHRFPCENLAAFIQKPYQLHDLSETLQAILDSETV